MTLNELVELIVRNGLDVDEETQVYLKEGDKIIPLRGIESYSHIVSGHTVYVLTGELE